MSAIIYYILLIFGHNSLENHIIHGSYEINLGELSATLALNENHTFSHKIENFHTMMSSSEEYIGTYDVVKHQVIFKPTFFVESYIIGLETESDTIEYNPKIHLFRDTLDIFHWYDEVYLLGSKKLSLWGFPDSCDYLHFVNNFNCTNESPANHSDYWQKKSPYFKKGQLPYPWNEYILSEAITAEITAVESYINPVNLYEDYEVYESIKSIVTINKGSNNGLKIGMKMYALEGEKCACDLHIFEINEYTSKGYTEICGPDTCQVDTKLSTKWRA